jgi:hypothetical protein
MADDVYFAAYFKENFGGDAGALSAARLGLNAIGQGLGYDPPNEYGEILTDCPTTEIDPETNQVFKDPETGVVLNKQPEGRGYAIYLTPVAAQYVSEHAGQFPDVISGAGLPADTSVTPSRAWGQPASGW